jgi:TnpA family transposase
MARMTFLSDAERQAFDLPPQLSHAERSQYFEITASIQALLNGLRTETNRVYCLLTLGYFRASKRFFNQGFHADDIAFVAHKLQLPLERLDLKHYDRASYQRHKQLILNQVGFVEFDDDANTHLVTELHPLIRSHKRPRLLFFHALDVLIRRRVALPSYHTLFTVISSALHTHQRDLIATIDKQLPKEKRELLDTLFSKEGGTNLQALSSPDDNAPKWQRYKLTLLKHFSHSTQPSKIKTTVADVSTMRELYQSFADVLDTLDLPHEGIRFYAHSVLQSQVPQLTRRAEEDRYLHLIAFIKHQVFRGNDTLVDILLNVVQSISNSCQREHKEKLFQERGEHRKSLLRLIRTLKQGTMNPLESIERIAFAEQLSDQEKIAQICAIFTNTTTIRHMASEEFTSFEQHHEQLLHDADYYDVLESLALKMQNRVADIVKTLPFEGERGFLLDAIVHFHEKQGMINATAPSRFLSDQEQAMLFTSEGKFRISLYKCLLFIHVAQALKSGTLNLKHSYKYRSLDDYLIPVEKWQANKDGYLQRAAMRDLVDPMPVLAELRQTLDKHYHDSNQRIKNNENPLIKFHKDGSFVVTTPKFEEARAEPLKPLFPEQRYISLLEVLHTISKQTGFLESFEHWQVNRTGRKPAPRTFFAGIMGYGCNLGLKKMATISKHINASELETTSAWYFSLDNLLAANDKIVALMDQMTLPNLYRREPDKLHTSSDGQKVEVAVDSLNANYSFKYFGQGRGVSNYTFIDERHLMFYSTVISAAEREAAYVIDGLMHNDTIQSDLHSTDTHGYSEVIFAVTHLLGFSFAPRIKSLKKQRLYSFEKRSNYRLLDYKLLPDAYLDTALITRYWDDILRFVVTIKLKEATASQLFKRLNAYAKQHPLYKALKEFGKLIKTLFILRYVSEVELRQAIEKQLNKGENNSKFSRAVSFGNETLSYAEKEQQDIAEACCRLIKNAILCWNYLYLSQTLHKTSSKQRKQQLLASIQAGSVMRWQHINLHGEYDFSDDKLTDSLGLSSSEWRVVKGLEGLAQPKL